MAGVVLAEQLHEAVGIVGAAGVDSSSLRQYGIESESVAEFVGETKWMRQDTGAPVDIDPISLAMGIMIGIVARDQRGDA